MIQLLLKHCIMVDILEKIFDYEPSNNKIVYNGASFFKFKDGKIIKIKDIWVLGEFNPY